MVSPKKKMKGNTKPEVSKPISKAKKMKIQHNKDNEQVVCSLCMESRGLSGAKKFPSDDLFKDHNKSVYENNKNAKGVLEGLAKQMVKRGEVKP